MKKGLKWSAKDFSVNFDPNLIDTNDILDIHKYLMKKKTMFGLIKKIFIGFSTGLVNVSNHTKCLS